WDGCSDEAGAGAQRPIELTVLRHAAASVREGARVGRGDGTERASARSNRRAVQKGRAEHRARCRSGPGDGGVDDPTVRTKRDSLTYRPHRWVGFAEDVPTP